VNGYLTRLGLILTALTILTPASASAQSTAAEDGAKTHAFELGAFLTATWLPKGLAVDAGVQSDRNIGFGGAISLAYRGPFFLYPFIDIGFFNLADSTINPVTQLGLSDDTVENSLYAWTFTFGPGVDVGPMRFRGGVGMNRLETSVKGPDFEDDIAALGFVTSLQVSGALARTDTFRLNAEGRITYLVYAGAVMFALGVSGAADVISW
jgi:hypothetical protein